MAGRVPKNGGQGAQKWRAGGQGAQKWRAGGQGAQKWRAGFMTSKIVHKPYNKNIVRFMF